MIPTLQRRGHPPRHDERHDGREDERRGTQQKRDRRVEAHGRAESWEVRIEAQRGDLARHRHSHPPHLPVLHREPQAMQMSAALRLALVADPSILLHAPQCEPPLLVAQPARGRREVRQDEDRAKRDEDRQCALDVEEPAPGGVPELAVHAIEDARGDEGAESV